MRDPFGVTEDDALVCLSEIPQNSLLYVLKGSPEYLLDGAREVADDVIADSRAWPPGKRTCLIMDCYSRAAFLGEHFQRELALINDRFAEALPTLTPEGVLALGEIASDGGHAPDMHNKTCLVAILHD